MWKLNDNGNKLPCPKLSVLEMLRMIRNKIQLLTVLSGSRSLSRFCRKLSRFK